MGFFVQNHVKNYAQTTGTQQRNPFGSYTCNNYQNFNIGDLLCGLTPELAGMGLQALASASDGKGGSEEKEIDPKTQKQIDAKELELQNLYSSVGVSNEKGLYKKIKAGSKDIEKGCKELNALYTSSNNLQTDLSALTSEYNTVAGKIDQLNKFLSTKKNDNDYNSQLAALNEKLQSIQEKIDKKNREISEVNNKITNKNNEFNTKKAEFAKLTGVAAQAENIVNEILQLEGSSLTHDVKYDIKQETEDLGRFNAVLKSFPKNGATQDDADEIINAFNGNQENTETAVNQRNAVMAMKMIKLANPNLNWSKLNLV